MKNKRLKTHLEDLYRAYDNAYLNSDPLWFVHQFRSEADQEVAGLIASSLAYGRVEQIKKSITRVLDVMDWRPAAFTLDFSPGRDSKLFTGFRHRFNSASDIACLIYFARQMFERSGSIKAFFMEGMEGWQREKDSGGVVGNGHARESMRSAIASFSERTLGLDIGGIYGRGGALPARAGVRFFFPSPFGGSACKRLNLYLRWMVRRGDSLDLGLWKEISPSTLLIPLDTHIARISGLIGLTSRKTPGWAMAEEITGRLRALDPVDPVKYDFALSRLGILKECPSRREVDKCRSCLIKDLCVL